MHRLQLRIVPVMLIGTGQTNDFDCLLSVIGFELLLHDTSMALTTKYCQTELLQDDTMLQYEYPSNMTVSMYYIVHSRSPWQAYQIRLQIRPLGSAGVDVIVV